MQEIREYPSDFVNQIILGDATEVMKSIPDKSIDLVVTSPPYNLKNSTGNGLKDGRGGKWANAALLNGYANHADCMLHAEYVDWQRTCIAEMLRILTNTGATFYVHKNRVQGGLLQDRHDILAGFPVRQVITWKRAGGLNFNSGYFLPTTEQVYLIAKPEFQLAPGANRLTDVWEIGQERSNPHPAPFPLGLAERCIGATEARIVLDPFVGSGTTALAARRLGRDYIGIDISPEYCQMAETRLAAHGATPPILYRVARLTS
jgi:site-specific DNA-methyltransferase (adenine-specific)